MKKFDWLGIKVYGGCWFFKTAVIERSSDSGHIVHQKDYFISVRGISNHYKG